ncbi:MAG: exodeoxyribonuclease VII large subunit [Clostridia bacterium]|nr:exodeoxyribonuclease VII large subunit [Clostridia bacterium]
MADKQYITVSELNFYLNRIVASEELLQNIPVLGEVSGISVSGNNLYFTIKDESAQLQACFFNFGKGYMPISGEQVLLYGSPDFYARGGRLSFLVNKIEPFGKGKLYAELEKLKQKLAAEGLFDPNRKKPLPKYPLEIGVVTSMSGAVIFDIVNTIRRRNQLSNITLINVPVQGDSAPEAICTGLALADKQNFDAVILARGGGSFEDLLPFNNEKVARAVFQMKTVTVSAVGHETDYSLTDFAADARAMTPTAAAEMLAFDTDAISKEIISKVFTVGQFVTTKIDTFYAKVQSRTKEVNYICSAKLNAYAEQVRNGVSKAKILCESKLTATDHRTEIIMSKLSALNPANLLQKGYFRVMSKGKDINKIEQLALDDIFKLYGADGSLEAKVLKK